MTKIETNFVPDATDQNLLSKAEISLAYWDCQVDGAAFLSHTSLIVPVSKDSEALIIKVPKDGYDLTHASNILKFYNGHGAVALKDFHDNVQLMERAIPSEGQPSLERMVLNRRDNDATTIIGEIITKLHSADPKAIDTQTLKPFSYRSSSIQVKLNEGTAGDLTDFFRLALEIHDELDAQPHIPVNADLHHYNISGSDRGWLSLDPEPVMAPAVVASANSAANPFHYDVVVDALRMDRFLSIISETTSMDKDSLVKAAFLNAAQVASRRLGRPEVAGSGNVHYWLSVAQTAAQIGRFKPMIP